MTKAADIIRWMDQKFPRETAESYDNPGLITGSADTHVSSVVLSLDATEDACECCIANDASLLITHHPLIFGGLMSAATDGASGYTGRILSMLIKNDISCFAAHTNLDKNEEFSNKIIASRIGCEKDDARPVDGASCGVIFDLEDSMYLGDYIDLVKDGLGVTGVITISPLSKRVRKIFVQGGAFDGDSLEAIAASGADAVVSGEIKHHHMVIMDSLGIAGIIAGHRETEQVYLQNLADKLSESFPDVRFLVSL